MRDEKQSPKFFDSAEVAGVVGIPPIYLNKFIERKKYGIEPSIRAGKGRGSRRLFSEEDVLGIALVWWLFESGLRSKMIQKVLNESVHASRKNISASDAAWILRKAKFDTLAIQREPRIGNKRSKRGSEQKVILMDLMDAGPSPLVENLKTEILVFIPVHNLFEKLTEAMDEIGV